MTKVYRYGLLPPTRGGDLVDQQMRAAHRYQNTLIEHERARRTQYHAVLAAHDQTAAIETEVAALVARLDTERGQISAARVVSRRRDTTSAERRAQVTGIRDELRDARQRLKAAKGTLRADPAIRAHLDAITDEARRQAKHARATCGVYWGTYLLIEQAMDAARKGVTPPRFRHWTGDSAVAVQIQHGMTPAEATGDTRLQIDLVPQPVPGRRGQDRPRVRLRVGSDGRAPVWAEWPLIYHRPLPADARITWAKVVRRRVAARDEWSLHVTVDLPDTAHAESCGSGVVAIDLGWRQHQDTLRAGGWTDGHETKDILLSPTVRHALRKGEDLRSIRDTAMHAIRATLLDWRETQETLTSEQAERLRWVPQWRSPARVAGLARWWREHRLPGDDALYAALEAWRRHDKHLWLWETHARRGALARRRDAYRVLAATLARRYDTLVIERLDLRALAAIPTPESERKSHPVARSQRHETAPSELRTALVQAFRARGGQVVTVPPQGPAEALLAAYRERSGVEEMPGTARVSRFHPLRRSVADTQPPADGSS